MLCRAALAALLSYHPRDVSANAVPPNPSVRNWIGPFGAWLAYYWFFWAGAAAYLFPVLFFAVGLGCFLDAFAYLRRRWAWALVLVLCCMGFWIYTGITSGSCITASTPMSAASLAAI